MKYIKNGILFKFALDTQLKYTFSFLQCVIQLRNVGVVCVAVATRTAFMVISTSSFTIYYFTECLMAEVDGTTNGCMDGTLPLIKRVHHVKLIIMSALVDKSGGGKFTAGKAAGRELNGIQAMFVTFTPKLQYNPPFFSTDSSVQ